MTERSHRYSNSYRANISTVVHTARSRLSPTFRIFRRLRFVFATEASVAVVMVRVVAIVL